MPRDTILLDQFHVSISAAKTAPRRLQNRMCRILANEAFRKRLRAAVRHAVTSTAGLEQALVRVEP